MYGERLERLWRGSRVALGRRLKGFGERLDTVLANRKMSATFLTNKNQEIHK